ncbi:Amuc_1098 family type IV pilus outer membrane protein [Verrucomicrobiales bacterium BCK34]|nr:Amuc_1098 family type IV pilus outer membrane protein [Verrucomicrobiales bacterium BCK34]
MGCLCAITSFACISGVTAGSAGYGGGGSGVPSIASHYVIRLQERVKKADEAALRGSQLMADGDYQGAIDQYRNALDLLPDAPMTEPRRRAYIKQFARASVLLARDRANEGRYPESIALVEEVLQPSVDPDNIEAKKLLEQLNDPDYYSPALTPSHLERVRRVKLALKTGQGYVDLGDYDRADREYHKALSEDPYNTAARRGQENNERHRMNYYDAAYDHTRSRMLRQVAAGWESPVPSGLDVAPDIGLPTDTSTTDIRRTEEKLKTIIIPSIEFADTPLKDALDFIQQRSVELDISEQNPAKKGINIILDAGTLGAAAATPAAPAGGDDGGFGFAGGGGGGGALDTGGGIGDTRITLRLGNVPIAEALRYTTSLAQLKYKVEPHAVVVIPLSQPDADLFTNTYVVPPTFLSMADGGGGGGGGGAAADPFADPGDAGGGGIPNRRKTAKEILESAGISFSTGASAIYNPATSQLIVRNTQDQMELVEAYIESIITGVEKQIYITSSFVEIAETDTEELGFDWLVGPFNFGSQPRVFGSGGTFGNQIGGGAASDYSFVNPANGLPVGTNPLTSGLRSGSQAISGNSIDALIAAAAGTGAPGSQLAPAVFGISGVFTDPQFQLMIRALNQRKGTDLLSAPSVMARSGQRAKVEVIREFIYPTEYDPPEIPNTFGGTQTVSLTPGGTGSSGGGFPVTPATPTAFETRNTGVTLEVDPVLGADEYTVDLSLAPEVVEFSGFINYGSPIQTTSVNALGIATPVVITENRIEMPVFDTRKVSTQVTIWDGQTVALGGLIREDIQDVEDKVPIIGDLPVVGRLFRSSVELHLKKNLTIFVKAQLMDPSGMPIHGRIQDEPLPEPVPRPPITTPTTFAPGPIPYQK